MDFGLVVLRVGRISVRGNKGEYRDNVRKNGSVQPIDTSNNTMIYLFLTCKMIMEGVNRRNGVDGEPGTIWSHVGNLV